jgi:hypothetical protein
MGSASGYLSVLVLALYINSREVTELYTYPDLLRAACPPLLYWLMSTTQQNMTSDLKNSPKITFEEWSLILTGAVFFWLFFLYLTSSLHVNVVSSDPKFYWELSLSWTVFHVWWVPGYPLLLAVVRTLTFNVLPPALLMASVSCIFFLISIRTTYRIAQHLKLPAYEIALLFTVYPLVGLVYAAWPFADSMATAVLLLSLLAFLEKRWVLFTGYAAVGMVTHKALWYFLPLLALAALWTDRESRRSVPFMVAPVLLLLVIGSFQQGDALWMFRWSVNNLIKSTGSLPILDGLLGPFMLGVTPKVLKGAVAAVILSFAIVVFVSSLRRQFWAGVCVSASIILLTCSVNQTETTSVIRYSKVLLIFVAYAIMTNRPQWLRRKGNWTRIALAAVVIASILSNMGFGYYAAQIYFGHKSVKELSDTITS